MTETPQTETVSAPAAPTPSPWGRKGRVGTLAWLLMDAALMAFGTLLAVFLRYDLTVTHVAAPSVLRAMLFAALGYLAYSLFVALMRTHHVRGSFEEAIDMAQGVGFAILVLIAIHMSTNWLPTARSLPITGPLFGLMTMAAARFIVRSWRWGAVPVREQDHRALVFGAGGTGTQLVRSLNRDQSTESARFVPVAFLDDDRRKQKMKIDGVRVSGTGDELLNVADRVGADTLIIATAQMSAERMRTLTEIARSGGLDVMVLPPVNQMFRSPRGADLRRLNLEDLLGRQRIELDQAAIRHSIAGKRVLVTGAGGSIGSELCRQINKYSPAKLVLLDRDESAMHAAQMSLTGRALLDDGTLALCDIRDADAVQAVFERERPDVVFHAAALKHLTLLEQFPLEGWKTNVLGTRNVLEAAHRCGVQTFVNISTDKAAWPSSVLGYTKRLAERLTANYAKQDDNVYVSVRFGNVLGSRGSVITAFTAQIESGGPVTVTDPEVERFFMLIPEACQLVLQASAIGTDGEVMVLAMGKPVKILDVAKSLIEMSGKSDIDIEFTGLRPGEKLSEQLFTPGEDVRASSHPLVSHVSVPDISPDEVLAQHFADPEEGLEWMVAHSQGHRNHDPSQDIAITADGPQAASAGWASTSAGSHAVPEHIGSSTR